MKSQRFAHFYLFPFSHRTLRRRLFVVRCNQSDNDFSPYAVIPIYVRFRSSDRRKPNATVLCNFLYWSSLLIVFRHHAILPHSSCKSCKWFRVLVLPLYDCYSQCCIDHSILVVYCLRYCAISCVCSCLCISSSPAIFYQYVSHYHRSGRDEGEN